MNKNLHSIIPPDQEHNGNLGIAYVPEHTSSSFLFEPKELVPFQLAWDWQKKSWKNLVGESFSPQSVWFLQHFCCYTLGRGGNSKNLLFDLENPPYPLYRIDRGGEVTHQLPGQLVVYLALDLHNYKTDLNWFLRKLEQIIIDVMDLLGLHGHRVNGLTGVWCNGYKVASIGIGCRRWITQHGFSLNIDCDLSGFEEIVACGLRGHRVGRLDYWLPGLKTQDVQPLFVKAVREQFQLSWIN